MRTSAMALLKSTALVLSVMAVPLTAAADYTRGTDLISLHYDHAPDKDDGHATVAGRVVTAHFGITPLVVSGAYGTNASGYQSGAEAVMRATWGDDWLDAHDDWEGSVTAATQAWMDVLDAGGDIHVAEGGQADFTADVVRRIQAQSSISTEDRIFVVQHSVWNEDQSTAADLNFVRANTNYLKIDDGNGANSTADLNLMNAAFVTEARNSEFGDAWDAAFNYLNPNSAKLDFSDTVELLEILDIGRDEVANPMDFADMFFNVDNEEDGSDVSDPTGPLFSTPQIWSDSYAVDGQCFCDSSFDHGLANETVELPDGTSRTVPQVCAAVREQFGTGSNTGRVYYNSVQCGHDPINNAVDETLCPGIPLAAGNYSGPLCSTKGPTWNLDAVFASDDSDDDTETETPVPPVITEVDTDDSITSSSFVAVRVEAESLINSDMGWMLTTATSAPISPDPDPKHLATASGTYLELLPDTRVSHSDPLQNGVNFWDVSGAGPSIDYSVNFPEAGKYIVWVKAYSTGTEDNGIHVGINGSTPASGARMQWCTGKNNWTWSSAQRIDSNHCGTPRTISIDVPSAGIHGVEFYAREDGFEIDQMVFLKETHDGSLSCSVNDSDQVVCTRNSNGQVVVEADIDEDNPIDLPIADDPVDEDDTDTDAGLETDPLPQPEEMEVDSEIAESDTDVFGDGIAVTATSIGGVFILGDENGCDHVVSEGVVLNDVLAQNRGVICLNSGVYDSGEAIFVRSHTTLRAADIGNPPTVNVTGLLGIAIIEEESVEIDSLRVESTNESALAVLSSIGSGDVAFINTQIMTNGAVGIDISESSTVSIEDPTVTGAGAAISLDSSSDITINRAQIASSLTGLHCMEGSFSVSFADSIVRGSSESGVIADNCSNLILDNLLITASDNNGVEILKGASDITVANTMILDSTDAAIRVHEGETSCVETPCIDTPSEVKVESSIFLFNNELGSESSCSNIRISEFVSVISQGADADSELDWIYIEDDNLFDLTSDPICVQ